MTLSLKTEAFASVDYIERDTYDFEKNVDPETNLFNHISNSCQYYTEEQFNEVQIEQTFSFIHFNCRSLSKHFSEIKHFLETLKGRFKLIALSETWIKKGKEVDLKLKCYDLYVTNRANRTGGGVALYIYNELKCRPVKCMTTAINDLMESVAVEIELEQNRNIVVACVYRKPGSKVENFIDKLEEMIYGLNNKRNIVICGDYNIDLLKVDSHMQNSDFLETLYKNGLYPLITKPSRITTTSATLIDNIFTNVLENQITSGLVINDTSDHLPIFAIFYYKLPKKTVYHQIYKRKRSADHIKFRNDLIKQEWKEVYTDDVNNAYNSFLKCYLTLYNKHCPEIPCRSKQRQNSKPWITNG